VRRQVIRLKSPAASEGVTDGTFREDGKTITGDQPLAPYLQGDMGIEEEEEKPSLKWIIVERQWLASRYPKDFISNSVRFPKVRICSSLAAVPDSVGQAIRKYFIVPPGFADRFAEDLMVLSNELCDMPIEESVWHGRAQNRSRPSWHMGLDPLEGYERRRAMLTGW